MEGLVRSGVKALRVGSGSSVRSSITEYTLDHKLSEHPLAPQLQKIVEDIETLTLKIDDLQERLDDTARQEGSRKQQMAENMTRALLAMSKNLQVLKSRKYGLSQQMLRDVLSDADVVSLLPWL